MRRRTAVALALVGGIALMSGEGAMVWRIAERRFTRAGEAWSPAMAVEQADPMARFRTEREQLRSKLVAQLNDIIYSDRSGDAEIAAAQRQLMALMSVQEQETTLEGLLSVRGFDGVLVSVSGQSATVLLRAESVSQREAAVILELVMRETGVTGGNVKIIPVK